MRTLGVALVVASCAVALAPRRVGPRPRVRATAEDDAFVDAEAEGPTGEKKVGTAAAAVSAAAAAGGYAATAASVAGTACVGGVCQVGAGAAAAAAAGSTAAGTVGLFGGLSALGAQAMAAVGTAALSVGLVLGHPQAAPSALDQMAAASMALPAAFSNHKPTVVEFYSTNCVHCREAAQDLYALETQHAGDTNWVMIDTNDEANRPLWESLGVDEIPHFAFFDGDRNLKATAVGAIK